MCKYNYEFNNIIGWPYHEPQTYGFKDKRANTRLQRSFDLNDLIGRLTCGTMVVTIHQIDQTRKLAHSESKLMITISLQLLS